MTYGIKHDNGVIQSICRFQGDVPVDFVEITKAKYDEFISIISINEFVTYDEVENEMVIDQAQQSILINEVNKENIKKQLKEVSIELDLLHRMSEDTTAKQAEFDALLVEYNRQLGT